MTSQREIRPLTGTDPIPALDLFKAPLVLRYLAAFLMTALATVVAVAVDSNVTIPNLSLVFVIPVIIAAVTFGFGSSFFSAILGALAYNFFLTEPRYTLGQSRSNGTHTRSEQAQREERRRSFVCGSHHKVRQRHQITKPLVIQTTPS
ncbi:DUF4118 domain-containing protein [Bradyrhizobium prioriisuperbiae]|uniref:DUF4118 domain-containing protein n=1 Tax=Bradyrhizobium prioriisuperbiae TaxID=2854389 RepID=UPI0028E51001|nr:DUF4118 domain-containing protein [Bradyrhizobium prioritasuperba]